MSHVIVPSRSREEDGEGFIELTPRQRTSSSRLFKKHILNKGTLIYPGVSGGKIEVDDEFVSALKKNFDAGVCDIVQVPLADSNNRHSEDPDRNIGEVVGIEESDGKVYAIIDARDSTRADKLGSTLLGASAFLSTNYKDTTTGEPVGPALLHVCVTNRPYVTGLEEYEEIVAASADTSNEVVVLTPEAVEESTSTQRKEEPRVATLNELLTELKLSHQVDVPAMQAKLEKVEAELSSAPEADSIVALTEQVAELTSSNEALVAEVEVLKPSSELLVKLSSALTESGVVELSEGQTLEADAILSKIADVVEENIALSATVKEAEEALALSEVEALVTEGRILPAQRDAMLELRLSNKEMFDRLVPEQPLVSLSAEEGQGVQDSDLDSQETDIAQEIARLTADGGPVQAAGFNTTEGK